MKGSGNTDLFPLFKHYLTGSTDKSTKNVGQDSQYLSQGSDVAPPKHKPYSIPSRKCDGQDFIIIQCKVALCLKTYFIVLILHDPFLAA
jgi:hypothetical protein